jgi:hypothetical protein
LTPFRELYRLDCLPDAAAPLLLELWKAAREGNLAPFIAARDAKSLKLKITYDKRPSMRYPGEETKHLNGISAQSETENTAVVTRKDSWSIRMRAKATQSFLGPDSLTPRDGDLIGGFEMETRETLFR